ncbi:MAG: beta-ribofuranosylaminobenzene 5'-phosphate synthase [Methanoregula sp.]|nr:beta-ribofuranosylaminobenzene 5'-phosphate synthase [Methanoregula sp.]
MDISGNIRDIEEAVGRLSRVQKILLGTDGSVTQLLESITGNPVTVKTLVQEIVPADAETAGHVDVRVGDPVNHRVVELRDTVTNDVLIYAISETPVERLSPAFKKDLMMADIPIGKIINRHHIEARREILSARVTAATMETGRIFSLCKKEPVLSRQYQIIHKEKPLIFIEEQFPYNKFLDERRIIVNTPSRIHVSLIDMHGGTGRVDGGIGITLDEPGILLEAQQSPEIRVTGCDPATQERLSGIASQVLSQIHAGAGVSITVRSLYPAHTGLGSGSQLALATARGICELYGKNIPVAELARLAGRGGTSGIGTAAFEHGGFIIDGGHRFGTGEDKTDFRPSSASRGVCPPPVIARHDFPVDWQILLATPDLPAGASGAAETDIFRQHCPVPLNEVQALCHEVLMRMLPGIASRDLDLFGSSINAVQHLGFKKVELGLQPSQVSGLLKVLREAGAAGAGLSSFGPTVYAIGDSGMNAIEHAAQSFMKESGGGTTLITSARNTGAVVRVA